MLGTEWDVCDIYRKADFLIIRNAKVLSNVWAENKVIFPPPQKKNGWIISQVLLLTYLLHHRGKNNFKNNITYFIYIHVSVYPPTNYKSITKHTVDRTLKTSGSEIMLFLV